MHGSGLSTKTNLRLSRRYHLFFLFRIAGMGFVAAGFLVALPLIVQTQIPLSWKIVCSASASVLAGLSIYFGVLFSKYEYSRFRYRVACRTFDEDLLEEMVQLDEDKDIRAMAVKRLENQSLLEEIALKDPSSVIRELAVKRLKNQSVLAEIALRDRYWDIRKTAASLVLEEKLLEKLLREAADESVILDCAFHVYKKYEHDHVFPENIGRALKQNSHAAKILKEPRCPRCFHTEIHFFHETRTESTCVLGCGDSIQYVYSDYEYNAYKCDYCGLESEQETPVTLKSFLPEELQR